jgi:apolipoprotein N-acyltransferase
MSRLARDKALTTMNGAALAVVSGLMLVIAAPPIGLWPLGWLFAAPVIYAIARAPSRRAALFCGWLAGFAANAVGFYWVVGLMATHAGLPWVLGVVALVLLAAYQALVFWLFAAAIWGLRDLAPLAVIAPLAMVAAELCVPFMFPWYAGVTQVPNVGVIQIAELTGPLGVTALTLATAGGAVDLLLRHGATARRRWLPVAVAVGVALLATGLGRLRAHQIEARRDTAPALAVGLVQANGAGGLGGDAFAQLRALQQVSAELEERGAELVVWPEAVYPFGLAREQRADFAVTHDRRLRRGFDVPLIAGAVTVATDGESLRSWNTAILVTGAGDFAARYDKIHLMPFGERVPLARTFSFIKKIMPASAGDFESGEQVTTFELPGARLGLMICYEDVLPRFARRLAPSRPQLLVNITNDSWFGTSAEPHQHLALAIFRAVEMRADLVRATINGVTAHIDATGRVVEQTQVRDPTDLSIPPEGLIARARLLGDPGFFARRGDWFGFACLAALLALGVVALRRRRR